MKEISFILDLSPDEKDRLRVEAFKEVENMKKKK